MRKLTEKELVDLDKSERRRQTAAGIQIRLSAYRGAISFIDALLDELTSTSTSRRTRLEPELVSRKGRLLSIKRGIGPLVNLFKEGQLVLLDLILKKED